jgi:hypothetical protein
MLIKFFRISKKRGSAKRETGGKTPGEREKDGTKTGRQVRACVMDMMLKQKSLPQPTWV